jgi:RNA polymerase sigma-B factor
MGLWRHLRDRRRGGLLGGWAATRLFLTVIAGVILLPACHPLTERPGHLAHAEKSLSHLASPSACSSPVSAGECVRLPPAAGGRRLRDLAGLDDRELLGMVGSLPGDSGTRAAACELLVARHRKLVYSCVRRYRGAPEPTEDLVQVGYVGLMKAISRFDPALGGNLAAYAQACISGEINRYFRDRCWPVHVKRSVQELVLEARKATSQLTQDLGRAPTQPEMARHLGVSGEDLREAQRRSWPSSRPRWTRRWPARLARSPWPTSSARRTVGWSTCSACRPSPRTGASCPPGEQKILLMRFHDDMTQAQIGQQLGISQMHVSRLSTHALGHLRQRLLEQEHASGAGPRAAPPVNARASAGALT